MNDLSVWTDEEHPSASRGRHGRHGRHDRRNRRRKSGFAVTLAMLVVLAMLAGGVAIAFGATSKLKEAFSGSAPDYSGAGTGAVQIKVAEGETVTQVGRTLKAKQVVKSVDAFVEAANAEPEAAGLQPGFYKLRLHMKASEALALLLDPRSRIQARVALPEGLRLDETLKKLAAGSKIPLAEFEKALKDARTLGLPAYAKTNAEGFLYPATYDVGPDAKAPDVLKQLFASYAKAADAVGVERTNRPAYEIVTVASLVEGEARHSQDFGKVARVVYNRLAKGMPLQFDSTVNYALKADKQIVTNADLGVDSPYNTYKHAGLPPGPISSPGEKALEAAVNPPAGDWLYFVTVNPKTGETKFTGDYQEFLRFKQELKSNQ